MLQKYMFMQKNTINNNDFGSKFQYERVNRASF